MAGVKGKSGGKRSNSGPEKGTKYDTGSVSQVIKDSIQKAADELAKEFGEPIEKAMLRLCYAEGTQDTVKASVWKSYLESMVVRETKSETKIEDLTVAPKLYIPERKKD